MDLTGGALGADVGGNGGAEGGATGGASGKDGGRGGAVVDGFLDVAGGGGGLPRLGGTGGGTFGTRTSVDDCVLRSGISALNRPPGFSGVLRRFAINGLEGCGGDDSVLCTAGLRAFILGAGGGLGARAVGSFGGEGRDGSGSD